MTIRTTTGTCAGELVVKEEATRFRLLWESETGQQVPAFCGIGSTYFGSELAAIGFGEQTWGLIARRAA